MFLNTVPVVMERTADLVEVARDLWETKRHRSVPYLDIIEAVSPSRISGRSTWLDACIGIMETSDASPLSWELLSTGETAFPILVMVRWGADGLAVHCQVQRRFGGADLAGRIVEEYTRGLERLTDARTWDSAGNSELVGPRREPMEETVLDVVSRRSIEIPHTDAIVDVRDGAAVDYGRLAVLSDRVAAAILGAGDASGGPVTLLFDHGPELAIAILGAMKAGGIAMPLPVNTPPSRLRRLLELSGSGIIVGTPEALASEDLASFGGETVDYEAAITVESAAFSGPVLNGADAAYLLFTSGSTGNPKPVLMPHAALANLVAFESDRSPLLGSGRCAQFAAVGFDVSLQEIFSTWSRGETLYPVPGHLRGDPAELIEFLERHEISRIHLPPLMARAIANTPRPIPRSIEEIICAGEALRIDDALRMSAKKSSFRLVNQYGPTETHVVTSVDLGADPSQWPELPDIGVPIDDVTIRIEDASGQPVDVGRSGEIVVQGVAVGLGYLGGEQGGFEQRDDVARYRTGDLGRVLSNGRIEFLGRRDGQVKISGFRV
jgi:amino acid adenylation domain-containing protein